MSFSRHSLWVGGLISVHSVAVIASNESDLLFYLIHGNFFCASKLAYHSAVTGNVFHLASQDQFSKKAHTHVHASFYRKFAEGKCTEREWNILDSLPWTHEPHLNIISATTVTAISHHDWNIYRQVNNFYLLDFHRVVFWSIINTFW